MRCRAPTLWSAKMIWKTRMETDALTLLRVGSWHGNWVPSFAIPDQECSGVGATGTTDDRNNQIQHVGLSTKCEKQVLRPFFGDEIRQIHYINDRQACIILKGASWQETLSVLDHCCRSVSETVFSSSTTNNRFDGRFVECCLRTKPASMHSSQPITIIVDFLLLAVQDTLLRFLDATRTNRQRQVIKLIIFQSLPVGKGAKHQEIM